MRSRAFRVVLVLMAGVWGFDRLVWLATQHSFFASVGLEVWFWRGLWAPLQLFGAFFGVCLVMTGLALRSLSPIEREEQPALRGILRQFEPLRGRILRISRALAIVLAALLARDFAAHGQEWLFLRHGERVGFSYLGLDAALWTQFLPLWMPLLLGLWKFALALGFLTLVTGVLRALPILAQRNSAPPSLARVLWRIAGALLSLRALLYASQTLDLPRGKPLESGDVWVLAPLYVLGALWCAGLSSRFLLRAWKPASRGRGEPSRAVAWGLSAAFLPAIAGALSWPLRAILPESATLKAERERATRAAWRLPEIENAPAAAPRSVDSVRANAALVGSSRPNVARADFGAGLERAWPVWDEAAVLALRPGAGFRGENLIGWKSATLEHRNGIWSALLAGESVGASAWNDSREVSKANDLEIERLELPGAAFAAPSNAAPVAARKPARVLGAYYGLGGRSLFGPRGGVDLSSPALKWAWAWRERDLLLPVDAALEPHLLAFRGARERAQVLAPWLSVAGEPRLHLEGENPVWTLDLCALSPHFPGAMRAQSGEFAGANSISAPLQMRMNARSGAVKFERGANEKRGLNSAWRNAFPEIQGAKAMGNFGVGGVVLRAQAEILAALGGQARAIYGPARGLNSRGQAAWRVTSVGKTAFECLESAPFGLILQRGAGDLGARLTAIDLAIAKAREVQSQAAQTLAAPSETASDSASGRAPATPRAGELFVWRDASAPGGFWVGRAFFAPPHDAPIGAAVRPGAGAHPPVLWRVALTALAPVAPVGVGESVRQALADFRDPGAMARLPRAPAPAPLNSMAPPKPPSPSAASAGRFAPGAAPEAEALKNQIALDAAARRGDWKTYGALAKRQTALLQRLVARRQNAIPSQNVRGTR